MTHTDFDHLLTSIKALTPEQVRQLRRQLDRQFADPKKRPAPASVNAAQRSKASSPKKKPLTRDEFNRFTRERRRMVTWNGRQSPILRKLLAKIGTSPLIPSPRGIPSWCVPSPDRGDRS